MTWMVLEPGVDLAALEADARLAPTLQEAAHARRSRGPSATTGLVAALASRSDPGVATALLCCEGELLRGGEWAPLAEHLASRGGMRTADAARVEKVRVLTPLAEERSGYAEWRNEAGIVCTAVRLSLGEAGEVRSAAVTLGGVAPYPLRARQVEATMRGRVLDDPLIRLAGDTARGEAQPWGVGAVVDARVLAELAELVGGVLRRLGNDPKR